MIKLCVLFDRKAHNEHLDKHVNERIGKAGSVATVVLPGPSRESHADFVARFKQYGLRRICREARLADIVASSKPLSWPQANQRIAQRRESLFNDLAKILGMPVARDKDALQETLRAWLGNHKQHMVLVYTLYRRDICRADAKLLQQWLEMWNRIDVGTQRYAIVVFFCVETPTWRISRHIGRSARCVKFAAKTSSANPNVLILPRLTAPTRADVNPWVDTQCEQAWALESPDMELPLNCGSLKEGAKTAFGRRKQRPFEYLNVQLQRAIESAHETYQRLGPGR